MEAILNFRQAGGVGITNRSGQRLKDGLLYRSARPDNITSRDKSMFQQLGIKTVIDLRGKSKYARNRQKPLQDMYTPCIVKERVVKEIGPTSERSIGQLYLFNMYTLQYVWSLVMKVNLLIRWLSVILYPIDLLLGTSYLAKLYVYLIVNKQTLSQHYIDLLEYGKFVVADILRVIINPMNLPLLIHCAHGKDRTGMITALILSCLDVEEEIIINDYAKSQEELNQVRDDLIQQLSSEFGVRIEFSLAKPETMRDMLNQLQMRYGSVSKYLVSAGFTLEEQKKLKNTLLES